MAIQMRRGQAQDFDPTRMLAGELAVVLGTGDGSGLYASTADGDADRVAFADEVPSSVTLTVTDGDLTISLT